MQTICKLWLIVAVGMGTSCVTQPVLDEATPPASHFREGEFEPSYPEIDELMRDWFSKNLRWMGEPSLAFASAGVVPTCRFTYLRSFHPAICVRIERHPDALAIISTVLAFDLDGDSARPLFPASRRELSGREPDWAVLRERLEHPELWLPPGSTEEELLTMDGAQWILEWRDGDSYQVVHRHSPEAEGPHAEFRRLCLQLLAAGSVELAPDEIY